MTRAEARAVARRGLSVSASCARRTPDVGGSSHNGRMRTYEMCERCFGTGADPVQPFAEAPDEITFCIECFGEGCVEALAEVEGALARAS